MPNMRAVSQSIFGGESARTVKGKSVGLKVLIFHPEYINNVFNGFIDHFQVGTALLVEFHHNLLNLQTLRSCKQINAVRADFRLDIKGPSSNCIIMFQILDPFLPQYQDMRAKCKLFLFNFIIRVAEKRRKCE